MSFNYQEFNYDEELTDYDIKDAWWYKFIIPLDSQLYNFWEIIIGLLSIVCSVCYAYFSAFGFPYRFLSV